MPGDVDQRLIGVVQAVMGLGDALRDAGTQGEVTIQLGRADGLLLLELVAGASNPEAEAWSQRKRPRKDGLNTIKIGHLTFAWPQAAASPSSDAARMFSALPPAVMRPQNDNAGPQPSLLRFSGFEEETPALR